MVYITSISYFVSIVHFENPESSLTPCCPFEESNGLLSSILDKVSLAFGYSVPSHVSQKAVPRVSEVIFSHNTVHTKRAIVTDIIAVIDRCDSGMQQRIIPMIGLNASRACYCRTLVTFQQNIGDDRNYLWKQQRARLIFTLSK